MWTRSNFCFELCEIRSHLSVTLTAQGTLSIVGTAGNDQIWVVRRAGELLAKLNAVESGFDPALVRRLYIDGGPGADRLENKTNLRCTMLGGSGRDRIIGGRGPDSIDGQSGADSLIASEGADEYGQSDDDGGPLDILDYSGWGNAIRFLTTGEYNEPGGGAQITKDQSHSDFVRSGVRTVLGTDFNDEFRAGTASNLFGLSGNDTFIREGGTTFCYGGNGDDFFQNTDAGTMIAFGEDGDDTQIGNEAFSGGDGIDQITLGSDMGFNFDMRNSPGVENLIVDGAGPLLIEGNDLNKRISAFGFLTQLRFWVTPGTTH